MKNTAYIPLLFNGGSGGHFLISFIQAAALNDSSIIKFSRFGNVHQADIDKLILHNREKISDVNEILNKIPQENKSGTPSYVILHANQPEHISTIMSVFEKALLITYDESDREDIARAFVAKFTLDTQGRKFNDNLMLSYQYAVQRLTDWNHIYEDSYEDNVKIITWKELYKLEPEILINKLSNFTGYEAHRFSLDKLMEWRRITAASIDLIARIIKE